MKIFIGCSSYDDIDKIYFEESKKVCESLIKNESDLIFGGCAHGLMGLVYYEFMGSKRTVMGVQTERYEYELDNLACDKIICKTTKDQLETFMELADVLMYLPGGFGTYNEIFYMISEYVNGTHNKPIIIININHYYDELESVINKIKHEKFAKKFDFIKIVNNIAELNKCMEEIC